MAKIILRSPLEVNGEKLTEFEYDVDGISPENFLEADARSSSGLAAKGIQNMNLAEFNSALHFYLGCFAIIAKNPSIDISDLMRLTGRDINKVRKVGQTFFGDTAPDEDQDETASTEKESESSSEATAESTKKSPKTSDK